MWATFQLGHIKWFVPDLVKTQSLSGKDWLVVAAIVAGGLLLATWLMGRLSGIYNKLGARFEKKRHWLPLIVRVLSGAGLLIATWKHHVIAPNVTPADSWMFGLQIFVGLCWILGIFEKFAALALALLLGWVGIRTGFTNVLEHFELLGAAAYLALKGVGPLSLGALFDTPEKIEGNRNYQAYRLYEVTLGVTFVAMALSEKLLNPGLAESFLTQRKWNFLSGVGASDWLFIIVIGSVELLFGLLLILNRIPRIVALLVLATLVATTALLDVSAVYGHLFTLSVIAVLLIGELQATVHLPKGRVRSSSSL